MRRRTALKLIAAAAASAGSTGAAAAAEKKKGGGKSYIQFPTLTASARRADGRPGVLSIEGGIDVPDPALLARAQQSLPILRDAYNRWLDIYAAALPPAAPPSPDQIQAELQKTTDRILGRPGAHFLIGTVMVN